MKFIVALILLVAIIAPGFAQRRCFTCLTCQQPFERNSDLVQTCTATSSPGPTTTPIITPELTTLPPSSPDTTTESSTTPGVPTDPTTTSTSITWPTLTSLTAVHALYKRDIEPFAENLRCFRIRRVIADITVYTRGCVELINNTEQTCAILGVATENCKICNEDECNGATQIITSVGTILAALLIVLKLY